MSNRATQYPPDYEEMITPIKEYAANFIHNPKNIESIFTAQEAVREVAVNQSIPQVLKSPNEYQINSMLDLSLLLTDSHC